MGVMSWEIYGMMTVIVNITVAYVCLIGWLFNDDPGKIFGSALLFVGVVIFALSIFLKK